MDAMSDPIAVTVIGGYLGAGKTTLVNHILRTADHRIAVLVNDFGDINIDADLIESQDGETISLANGCICCSLVDGLAGALATLKEVEPRPERLVIEASGVADPATVAAYGHSPGLALDAVIVLTDAETVRSRAHDKYVGDTVLSQIRAADVLVLNKVDLIEPDQVAEARSWLREENETALLIEAERSEVPTAVLFGVAPSASDAVRYDETDGHGAAEHDHGGHADQVFESWSWTNTEAVSRAVVEDLMAELPDSIVRAKGVLRLLEEPDRTMILQRVGQRWSLRRAPKGSPRVAESRLVLIGMRAAIDDDWLSERLAR